ncbi:hypothetical protein L7F22_068572 [Adiantum nelumboides]|nr:hypothetical protein [Adiantum nelumboides]
MIGPFFTSEKHSNANEDTHVGEGKELCLHMKPSMYINEPSVSSYEGQACASTIGHCKSHIDAIAPDNADVLPAAEREVPKNSNSCDTEHLLQQLIVDKTMLVDGSPQEPLNAQTDENACADIDAVIDICELIAESQYSSSASPELTRTSDPYKPRSASSHQRFPLEGSGCRGVSFGLKNEPLSIECALQPQPPNKKKNSLSLTSHDDDPDGFKHLPKQESYEFFRTRSGRISRRGSRQEQEQQNQQIGSTPGKKNRSIGKGNVSAGRYFDALRGPELEILKVRGLFFYSRL